MLLNNFYTHEQLSNHNNTSKRIKSLLLLLLSCIALSYTPKSNTMGIRTQLRTIGTKGVIILKNSLKTLAGSAGAIYSFFIPNKEIKEQDEKNRLLEAAIQETTRQLEEITTQQSKLIQEEINAAIAKLNEQHPGLIHDIGASLGTALSFVATTVTGGLALAKKIPLKQCLTYVYQDVIKKHPYASTTAIVVATLYLIKKMYGEQIYIVLSEHRDITTPQGIPGVEDQNDGAV